MTRFKEFLTLAYNSPRMTKDKTADFIEDIIRDGRVPTIDDLAQIYRYMMPARPARLRKNFTPFEWVAAAAGRDDIRHYLNWVYADGNRIMATDGHRIHIHPDDREPGYYCPAKGELTYGVDYHPYPDADRVIPNVVENYRLVIDPVADIHSNDSDRKPILKIGDSESYLKQQYWAEATAWGGGLEVYIPHAKDDAVRVDVPALNAMAVIMPVRV